MAGNKTCRGRALWIAVGIAALALLMAGGAGAATITVNASGGADYTTIQGAINNAFAGDTILVYSGTYYENIIVDKKLTINGINNPIINAGGSVVTLIGENISFSNFKIIGNGWNYPDAGIKILSNNNIIYNNSISNIEYGVFINTSNGIGNNSIYNNILINNYYGIVLESSPGNMLYGNIGIGTQSAGIRLFHSSDTTLSNNEMKNSPNDGIWVGYSDNNSINNNKIHNNTVHGISMTTVYNNSITNNTLLYNGYGIIAENSDNNTIDNNKFRFNSYGGINLGAYSESNILRNNIVSNGTGDINGAGGNGITVYYYSINNTLLNNIIDSNKAYGVYLSVSSSNNTIVENIVSNNSYGIRIENPGFNPYYPSKNNSIYHNSLINNKVINAFDAAGSNQFDSNYPSGGNYWSDYTGVDLKSGSSQNIPGSDGIGDTPYNISGGAGTQDRYPFMQMNGWLPPSGGGGGGGGGTGFDTGAGGYPSIMGTHNGTLRLNQSINVSKMYTYPSAGTGGHSEYVRIWNLSGWSIEAAWSGYGGDWHNITFAPFTLEANVTYNYTIRTGSYPQIIHKQNSTTSDGSTITSTEFIDVNDRSYTDWIPAIRLE